jgi:cytoskeletal protein CcmA (bactofilin family)
MKYFLAIFMVASGLYVPFFASANTVVRTAETVSIGENQSITGDFYAAGQSITMSGEVTGDVYVAGGVVTMNGAVAEDIAILGGTVTLSASTSEDVRIIAGDVTIAEDIAGDVVIVAPRAHILSTATVGGNVLFFGGDLTIEGEILGDVLGTVDRLRLDAPVAGVDVTAHEVALGDKAVVAKNLLYRSANELTRAPGAVVSGNISRAAVPAYADATPVSVRVYIIAGLISLFATAVLTLIARRFVVDVASEVHVRPEVQLLYGMAALFVVPFAIMTSLVSVLGLLFGSVIMFLWIFLALITVPLINVYIGVHIAKYTIGYTAGEVPLLPALLGALALFAAFAIPIVGPIVFITLFVLTLGVLIRMIVSYLYW